MTRWTDDENLAIHKAIRTFLKTEILPTVKSRKDKMRIGGHATAVSVERELRHMLAIDEALFDAKPWLLNTPLSTIDLSRLGFPGAFRPPDRNDYITKQTAVAPAPIDPLWLNFIEFITNGDAELAEYLKRLCGCALVGGANEQIVAYLYGGGNNGKSVFLQAILYALGDYGVTVGAETFIHSPFPRKDTELMPMRGARLIVASEVEADARWDEARIKTIAGGERIRARNLYENSIEFDPPGLLMMAGNEKPSLRSTGQAIKRRFRIIPFTATVDGEMRDTRLLDKLKAKAGGVLQWMLDGCKAWQAYGLGDAKAVEGATTEYITDEDHLSQWRDECTIECNAMTKTSTKVLFTSWKTWAEAQGLRPGKVNTFSTRLTDMGLQRYRNAEFRGFAKIALREPLLPSRSGPLDG